MTPTAFLPQSRLQEDAELAALNEPLRAAQILQDVKTGHSVILKSTRHACNPVAVGRGLRVKVNANIGTSSVHSDPDLELEKLHASIQYGADTVMDLSTGGDIRAMRRRILEIASIPVGTVPVYEAIARCPDVSRLTEDDFLESVRTHFEDGVDFATLHCGLTQKCIPLLRNRIMGVVSRGGSFLIKWMLFHKKENPLYTRYDEILEMAKAHNVVLSLGDGLRPGCLADATDKAQITELKTLGELSARARARGVQVIVEGPGHVPLHMIKKNMDLQRKYCGGAPFYVLGPLVTDCSPGYDHLTGAIGGALAAYHGASFLCYLTPKEHLGLPDVKDVIDGVVASKIAAHAADIALGIPGARDRDDAMSEARSRLDWETMYATAFNPEKARALRQEAGASDTEVCSMCGELCSAKINNECREAYR